MASTVQRLPSGQITNIAHGVHADVDGGIVAQRHAGIGQVVIDGAGNAHARHAVMAQRLRAVEAAVAADDDQTAHVHILQDLGGFLLHLGLLELQAARGAQLRTGQVGDIQRVFQRQLDEILIGILAQQAVEAAVHADQGHAQHGRAARDGGYRRIHSRAVSAAGQHCDFSHRKAPSVLRALPQHIVFDQQLLRLPRFAGGHKNFKAIPSRRSG